MLACMQEHWTPSYAALIVWPTPPCVARPHKHTHASAYMLKFMPPAAGDAERVSPMPQARRLLFHRLVSAPPVRHRRNCKSRTRWCRAPTVIYTSCVAEHKQTSPSSLPVVIDTLSNDLPICWLNSFIVSYSLSSLSKCRGVGCWRNRAPISAATIDVAPTRQEWQGGNQASMA